MIQPGRVSAAASEPKGSGSVGLVIPGQRAGAPVLTFEGASRVHGRGTQAVHALHPTTLAVYPGELVAIMGPSGSGKSTLLSLAGALDQPTEGRVCIAGRNLGTLSPNELAALRRQVIGYIFQDFNLLPGLTAVENAALPLELDGKPLAEARRWGVEALAQVGMEDFADRFPDDLSGGEQQRVAIARAFAGPRTLLLADEPTGALDSLNGETVMRLLKDQCAHGRTVVVVTHDATHAAWADRVLFLRDGRLVDETVAAGVAAGQSESSIGIRPGRGRA